MHVACSSAQVTLRPGVPLKWECCTELPVGMRDAQAVVLGNKVFVGGGFTPIDALDSNVYVCEFPGDITWRTLEHSTRFAALTTYQERLVLVGGESPCTGAPSNQLWMLEDEQSWTQPLPSMPTPRSRASAMSFRQYLVVVGGVGYDVIEVYNGQQWARADTLPRRCFFMKSTLHDGFLYLTGGENQGKSIFQFSLQTLTLHSPKKYAPHEWCSVTAFGRALVTVGGWDNEQKNSLHMYDPITQSWEHVGEMPEAVDCTCTVTLPSGEMLVIGGRTAVTVHSTLVYIQSQPPCLDSFEVYSTVARYNSSFIIIFCCFFTL